MEIQRDYIMPATLYGAYEMELHPITLSFPEHVEGSFLDDFYTKSLTLVRFSLFVGILMYSVFGILDAVVAPEMIKPLWIIRFAIVCPFLLAIILFSYTRRFRPFFQFSVTAAMIVAGFGIVFMILIMPPPANYTYYAGLILVLIWGYTFTRVRFIWATLAGWLIVVGYQIVAIGMLDTPTSILMSNNFFFISANLAGMLASYSIEYYARRDFFLTFKLENERQVVEAANKRLESIVQERTSQLLKMNTDLRQEIDERKKAEEERKELENMLIQAQKMEALGTLAGGIAHDFNNLLMGIHGHSSLMLMDMKENHPFYENVNSIDQYVKKGADLTSQLLAFAMGGKYEVKTTDLNELIRKSSLMFGRTKKEVMIHVELQQEIWPVDVDQGQIEQVLLNLFVNAWQAMPDGGDLYITTENITLDTGSAQKMGAKLGSYVKTSVRDTGTGMDEATIHRIFDPFFTTKAMGKSTGLGLASVYGILKNHGGFIQVESKKNEGSVFSFFLPVSSKKIARKGEYFSDSAEEMMKGSEMILLVDDEEMIIKVAERILKKLGYRVMTAQNGQEAVEIYRTHRDRIDLVILDMIMPGMGGKELYNTLKKMNPEAKVLLSSGYSIDGEAMEIMESGCNGFLQKPFSPSQLSQKIREILDPRERLRDNLSEKEDGRP
ncbi:MAG: response regulator [Syntrophales bacterium]|nr:response regulator [Syntrophales bacterium]